MSFIQITGILVADCYIDHVDPSPVDYFQVSFDVTCRVSNKGFLDDLHFLLRCQLLRYIISDHHVF